MAEAPLSFVTRLWFAWACFFRVLLDGAFAARAFSVRERVSEAPALKAREEEGGTARPSPKISGESRTKSTRGGDGEGAAKAAREAAAKVRAEAAEEIAAARGEAAEEIAAARGEVEAKIEAAVKVAVEKASVTGALQVLALFQREGRLVDFLEQDVASYPDADVGAAARVVHEGCRKALRQHGTLSAVRSEDEGAQVTIGEGYDAHEVKLVGNVTGKAPYKGVLRHKGWRLRELVVATPTKDHDATVLAPAEVEL